MVPAATHPVSGGLLLLKVSAQLPKVTGLNDYGILAQQLHCQRGVTALLEQISAACRWIVTYNACTDGVLLVVMLLASSVYSVPVCAFGKQICMVYGRRFHGCTLYA